MWDNGLISSKLLRISGFSKAIKERPQNVVKKGVIIFWGKTRNCDTDKEDWRGEVDGGGPGGAEQRQVTNIWGHSMSKFSKSGKSR